VSRRVKQKQQSDDDDMRTLLEQMPWRGKFTADEVAVFEARRMRLVDAMTDAIGLFGQVMYTDPAHTQLLAAHIAMELPEVPLVMWARLYLGRHTLAQTIAGACLGCASFATLFALRGIAW
jgi:hypothetical protein